MLPSIMMTSALAAAVLATPLQHFHKRDYVTVTLPAQTVTTNVATVTVVVPAGPAFAGGQTPDAQAANKEASEGNAAAPAWGGNFGPPGAPGDWGHQTDQGNPPIQTHAQPPPGTTTVQQPTANTQTIPQQPPSSPTNTPPDSSPPSQPPSANAPYQSVAIYHHNIHRANHSASAIQWLDSLASTAQKIAASCIYEHQTDTDGGGYGQNIAAGVESSGIDRIITDMFYNGEVNYYNGLYGQASPDMTNFEHWGHFSQIVWQKTTHVGCATQYCPGGLANTGGNVPPYFTVCNYSPPGNFAGQYKNVGSPENHPSVIVSDK